MKGLKTLLGHRTYDMTVRYTQYVEVEDTLEAYEDSGPLDWMRQKSTLKPRRYDGKGPLDWLGG